MTVWDSNPMPVIARKKKMDVSTWIVVMCALVVIIGAGGGAR